MKVMGISEYANVLSKRLSGGTKRKLSFTISIIGDPDVIIMDEPSTGFDFNFFFQKKKKKNNY